MNDIRIENVAIKNFKNFAELNFDFDKTITTLYGRSGSGKSTIMNAWLWVCGLDIDSPYPKIDNKLIEDLETVVEFNILVNGRDYKLKRTATQKWKVNKLENTREFNGYEASNFEFDLVPMKSSAYQEKLIEIIGLNKFENLKFLCSSSYFNLDNGQTWGWQKRREILYRICNVESSIGNIADKEEYSLIKGDLVKKSTTELKKQLNNEKKQITETKNKNEILIIEKQNELNSYSNLDFEKLSKQAKKVENEIEVERQLLEVVDDRSAEIDIKKQISEKQNQYREIETQDNQLLYRIKCECEKANNAVQNSGLKSSRIEQQINRDTAEYKRIQEQEWKGDTVCPTCHREIESDVIADLMANFNKDKANKLDNLKTYILEARNLLEIEKNEYTIKLGEYEKQSMLLDNFTPTASTLPMEMDKLTKKLLELQKNKSVKDLNKINELKQKLREINERLAFKQVKTNIENRIAILVEDQQNQTNAEILNAKRRSQLEQYTLETISLVNETINSHFDKVKFNLFDTLTAGADNDIKETCVVMLDGKTYDQLSTGEKLFANFDTIKGLQNSFGVSLPIFFDECQSSTFEKVCSQQLIELNTCKKSTNLQGIRINEIYGGKNNG